MARTPKAPAISSIGEEHCHLREMTLELRAVLSGRTATRSQVARLLRELTQEVLGHFAHEESGGYFAEAIGAAPRLSERAAILLAEHAQMTRQLETLWEHAAADLSGLPWWRALESEFAKFTDRFSAHEEAENALLQEAYLDDIGTED